MIEGPVRAGIDDFEGVLNVADTCFFKERDLGGMRYRWPHCYIRTSEFISYKDVMNVW